MSDLAMDDNNDLLITNGDLSLVTGSDAIAQDLQQSLQFYFGEWFLDTTVGIPYLQKILVKNPNIDEIQSILLNAAGDVDGVTDITGFQLSYDTEERELSPIIQAKTTTGDVIQAQASISANASQGG